MDSNPNGHSFSSFAVKKIESVYYPVFESNDYRNDFTGNTWDEKLLDEGNIDMN